MYAYVYVYVSMYMCMCMYMYLYIYTCVCMYTCVRVHVYVYMCMYVYESICIFAESLHAFTGVVEHHACAGVYVDRCCEHQRTHLLHARYRMCICTI